MPAQDEIVGTTITLTFGDKHKFHFTQLKTRIGELSELVERLYGTGFELVLEGPGDSARKKF